MPPCTPLSSSPGQWETEVTPWRAGTLIQRLPFILFRHKGLTHPPGKESHYVVIDSKWNSQKRWEKKSSDHWIVFVMSYINGDATENVCWCYYPLFIAVPYINSNDVANILDLQMVTCSNCRLLKMLHYLIRHGNSLVSAQIHHLYKNQESM